MGRTGTVYKGIALKEDIKFSRVWAMPNAWTYEIQPIRDLLNRYVGNGDMWLDPFAGKHGAKFVEITNDINPDMPTHYHMEAVEFLKLCTGRYNGILYDPPYSFRQISEHYKSIGLKATQQDTSMKFYEKVKSEICDRIKPGGYAICFGWNTNGFGKGRGFKLVEIMAVAHGGSKNDTLVTVERKL